MYVGFDPGFGNAKVAAICNDTVRTAVTPSVVGVGDTDMGMLDDISIPVMALERRREREVPDQVTFDGMTYLVGEHVSRYTKPLQRMDFMRLGGGAELQALFYNTMWRLLGEGEHRGLKVMVGLPIEVMQDKQQAQETRRKLRHWLIGDHNFDVNDEIVILEIKNVEVMSQPAGAFFGWGLNAAGTWIRSIEDLKASVAVCDIGFNTLDLFVVTGGRVDPQFTGGDTAGMRRAAETLKQRVLRAYRIKLSLHEADALIGMNKPEISTSQGLVTLSDTVKQSLGVSESAVRQFLSENWGEGANFAHILFVGGGSERLRTSLIEQYPTGTVLGVTANSEGMAKYAHRVME